MNIDDIRLVKTCEACPEQYDAFLGKRLVGYLRQRHGSFRVQFPDAGGEIVYSASTIGDGMFDGIERDHHLRKARAAILQKLQEYGQ